MTDPTDAPTWPEAPTERITPPDDDTEPWTVDHGPLTAAEQADVAAWAAQPTVPLLFCPNCNSTRMGLFACLQCGFITDGANA